MEQRINLPPEVESLLEELAGHGYEAYVVGGCVRDRLMGRSPGDWDITTDARPEEVKDIFGHTLDTGIAHGTVTVMRNKKGYEITTFRRDGHYSDGRHPDRVEFGKDLAADLSRRDFTVNAMAYSHERGLVDLFGGVKDIQRKRIACVGTSRDRFREDALRIVRALRFCAQLDFTLEEECQEAMQALASNLQRVSRERIFSELTKTLLTDHPEKMEILFSLGLHPYISEGFRHILPPNETFRRGAGVLPKNKSVRWSAFLIDTHLPEAIGILKELKSDNKTVSEVKALLESRSYKLTNERENIKGLLFRIGPEAFDFFLAISCMLEPERRDHFCQIAKTKQEIVAGREPYRIDMLAISGKDLLEAGYRPGPLLGTLLQKCLLAVMTCPDKNKKETLLALCRNEQATCEN